MLDADLKIELIGPDGTTITLADGVGGAGQNFVNTTFDNASKINIVSGIAPFTGTFTPQNAGTVGQGLDAYIGKQLQGAWKLQITDKFNNATTGVLNGWSLTATPAATVTPDPFGVGSLRVFRVGFPEQSLRGTYTLAIGPDIRSVTGRTGLTPADAGALIDTNQNAGLDLLFDRNPPGVNALPQTFVSNLVQAIPNNPSTPLVASIVVPASVGTFNIGDLNLQLSINHTRDADLKIEHHRPRRHDDPARELNVGGLGANFTNTVFDDQAAAPITTGTAPFSGQLPAVPVL